MAVVTKTNMNTKSVSDATIELYGDMSYVFKLLEDNSYLSGVNDTVNVNDVLTYDNSIVFINTTKTTPKNVLQEPVEKTIRIRENQTIFDLSLQVYGTVEGVFDLIERNPTIDNINNLELTDIQMSYVERPLKITDYFKKNEIFISTGSRNRQTITLRAFNRAFCFSFA